MNFHFTVTPLETQAAVAAVLLSTLAAAIQASLDRLADAAAKSTSGGLTAIETSLVGLDGSVSDTRAQLSRELAATGDRCGWWDVLGPFIFIALVTCMVIGDYELMTLRMAALFEPGTGAATIAAGVLNRFAALAFGASIMVIAGSALELSGIGPQSRIFRRLGTRGRRVTAIVLWLISIVAVAGMAAFFVYGQMNIMGANVDPRIGYFVVGDLAVNFVVSVALALPQSVLSLVSLLYMATYPIRMVLGGMLTLVRTVLNAGDAETIKSVINVLAAPVTRTCNLFARIVQHAGKAASSAGRRAGSWWRARRLAERVVIPEQLPFDLDSLR